jgi:hypothetical protein
VNDAKETYLIIPLGTPIPEDIHFRDHNGLVELWTEHLQDERWVGFSDKGASDRLPGFDSVKSAESAFVPVKVTRGSKRASEAADCEQPVKKSKTGRHTSSRATATSVRKEK